MGVHGNLDSGRKVPGAPAERSAAERTCEAFSSWMFAELQDSKLSQGCSSEHSEPPFGRLGHGVPGLNSRGNLIPGS